MSYVRKGPLSKRAGAFDAPDQLPNYTRPQGWAIIDPGKEIKTSPDELEGMILLFCPLK